MVSLEVVERPAQSSRAVSVRLLELENSYPGLFKVEFRDPVIDEATLHVWSGVLSGSMSGAVVNSGRLPLLRAEVGQWQQVFEGFVLANESRGIGFFRRGASVGLSAGWRVSGPLSVLWELARILFTGLARVEEQVAFSALGYRARGGGSVTVPVRRVGVAWD